MDQNTEVQEAQTPEVDEQSEFEAGFAAATGQDVPDHAEAAAPQEVPAEQKEVSEEVQSEPERPAQEAEGSTEPEEAEGASGDDGLPLEAFDPQTIKTLLANSSKIGELEQLVEKQSHELRRAYGKIGELNSHIKQLMKAPTQSGIKQAELRFERLSEEYPELAEFLREDLSKILGLAQQTVEAEQTGQTTQQPDMTAQPEGAPQQQSETAPTPDIDEVLRQRELQVRAEYEQRLLEAKHPDFREVASSPDFQIWLAGQPPHVQQVAKTSWSAEELSAIFDLFKSELASKRAATTQVKEKRLEAAVAPTTTTAAPSSAKGELDEFLEGFNAVMKQRL